MNPFLFYPLHLVVFFGGLALLWIMKSKGVPWPARASVGGAVCLLTAMFSFRISDPQADALFNDFYEAYLPAARALFAPSSGTGIASSMERGAEGFVNLPLLAYLFAPFVPLSKTAAGAALFALGLVASVGAWWSLVKLARLDRDEALVLLLAFCANGPLQYSFKIGNTTQIVLFMVLLGMLALRRGREVTAGVLLGSAALIKLPLLLLGVYFAARGRWRVALAGAAVCAAAGGLSILIFGWDLHVHWYEHAIKPFSSRPLSAYNNQSVAAFFARLDHGRSYLFNWHLKTVDPAMVTAGKMAGLAILGLAAAVFIWPRRWKPGRILTADRGAVTELEVCIVLGLAMVVSTVSWSHYYLWLLAPAAYLIGRNNPFQLSGWLRCCGLVAFIGAMLPVLAVHTGTPPFWGRAYSFVAVSHHLLSGLLLLAVLLVARWRLQPAAEVRE